MLSNIMEIPLMLRMKGPESFPADKAISLSDHSLPIAFFWIETVLSFKYRHFPEFRFCSEAGDDSRLKSSGYEGVVTNYTWYGCFTSVDA